MQPRSVFRKAIASSNDAFESERPFHPNIITRTARGSRGCWSTSSTTEAPLQPYPEALAFCPALTSAPPPTHGHAETVSANPAISTQPLITRDTVRTLEADLDNGEAIKALRRFNDNLAALPAEGWASKLRPVFNELAHDLETFNPAFTATMLKVQMTVGLSGE